jgi:hypothetical protein
MASFDKGLKLEKSGGISVDYVTTFLRAAELAAFTPLSTPDFAD